MTEPLHTLHLTAATGSRLPAVKAIRAGLELLRGEPVRNAEALTVLQTFESDAAALVGVHEDVQHLAAVAELIRNESDDALGLTIDADPADLADAYAEAQPDPEDAEADDDEFSVEVYRSAMVLLVPVDGNPGMARSVALSLAGNSEDEDFWLQVAACLLTVFPPPPGVAFVDVGEFGG